METTLLEKVRKLNWVLQESSAGVFSFNDLCRILSDMMDANIYIINRNGKILGVHYKIKEDSPAILDPDTGVEKFPTEYNDALLQVTITKANLRAEEVLKIFKYDYDSSDKLHTVVPVMGGGKRWGTLIMTRHEPEFSEEDLALSEYGATVVGLEIQRQKALESAEEERNIEAVRMALATLSYSEVEAVEQIFDQLEGEEGLLVASKIADSSGITRSVIVNALRKLASAGVIESRSLGMKGTHIKIVNSKFKEGLSEQRSK